mmetsp:Transcript_35253/g.111416  ORF Transcript_35253/g.111416 Transcript_35253/m.111416 type:complete len:256 (+) Transcript_35253:832-1599(+)
MRASTLARALAVSPPPLAIPPPKLSSLVERPSRRRGTALRWPRAASCRASVTESVNTMWSDSRTACWGKARVHWLAGIVAQLLRHDLQTSRMLARRVSMRTSSHASMGRSGPHATGMLRGTVSPAADRTATTLRSLRPPITSSRTSSAVTPTKHARRMWGLSTSASGSATASRSRSSPTKNRAGQVLRRASTRSPQLARTSPSRLRRGSHTHSAPGWQSGGLRPRPAIWHAGRSAGWSATSSRRRFHSCCRASNR